MYCSVLTDVSNTEYGTIMYFYYFFPLFFFQTSLLVVLSNTTSIILYRDFGSQKSKFPNFTTQWTQIIYNDSWNVVPDDYCIALSINY